MVCVTDMARGHLLPDIAMSWKQGVEHLALAGLILKIRTIKNWQHYDAL